MIKILSVDPGMHNLGVAFSVLDEEFVVQDYRSLTPSKHPADIRKHRKFFSDRTLTGSVISSMIKELVLEFDPDYITCEDTFYNPGRPQAFISLLVAITAMEAELYRMYYAGLIDIPHKARVYKIPPKLIKKVVSENIGGNANKLDMYDALKLQAEKGVIRFAGQPVGHIAPLSEFTEHSVDAIDIGYAFTKVWKPIIDNKLLDEKCTSFSKAVRNQLAKNKTCKHYFS